MSNWSKFCVRLNLEAFEDRDVPGNLLSAITAPDFLLQAVSQLKLIQHELPLANPVKMDIAIDFSLMILPGVVTPPVIAVTGIQASITPSSESDSTPLTDFRCQSQLNEKLEGLFGTTNGQTPVNGRWNNSTLASWLADAPTSTVSSEFVLTDVVREDQPTVTATVNDHSDETDTLTSIVGQKQQQNIGSVDQPMIPSRSSGGGGGGGNTEYLKQDVPINANNDNGSLILDFVPTKYDFNAAKSDYPLNTPDPELIPLHLIRTDPFQYQEGVPIGYTQYLLSVSQPSQPTGGGHIRFWDSRTKNNELTVFNTWTSEGMTPSLIHSGYYDALTIYMEGSEPSLVDDEITVSFTLAKVDTSLGAFQEVYETVKATVTPRLQLMEINESLSYPWFMYAPTGLKSIIMSTSTGLHYHVEIFADLVGEKGATADVNFIQNLTDVQGNLGDNAAMEIISGNTSPLSGLYKFIPKPGKSFPFLDSAQANYYPFYPKHGPVEDPSDTRNYYISMDDNAGFYGTLYSDKIINMSFYNSFTTWTVLSYVNSNGHKTIYSLGHLPWTVLHSAVNYETQIPYGLTDCTPSLLLPGIFERSHVNPIKRVAPFANDAMEIIHV